MSIAEDNLIFDLDGTLFDSAPEILLCLKKALQLNNINIKGNLNKSIIGPPLKETLKNLVQKKDTVKIDKIIENFIELYDSDYCYKTKLYEGVQETLKTLEKKKNLMLITNKGQTISCSAKTIRVTGIVSRGVKVLNTAQDEKVVSACLHIKDD